MDSLLAIAAPSFNKPSETFIRNHVRTIAPGRTVLLCQDADGTEQLSSPVLSGIQWNELPYNPLSQRAVNAVRRRWRRYVNPGIGLADQARVLEYFRAHRPRALLAEYGPTGCLFMRASEKAGVPLYVHFHGYDAHVLPLTAPHVIGHYKRLFAKAKGIIVTTEFLKQSLCRLGCPDLKLTVCPCGIDTNEFTPGGARDDSKTVLMVSRLIPQKGPLLSLRSFAILLRTHPDARLEIIGDGPLGVELEEEAIRTGIRERVCFHGAQPHEFVRSRLRAARMLIQHCVSVPNGGAESLGLSLLEAMACETPVVSTRHGAIPENVIEGVNGLLVNEHDVDGMAAAMAALLDQPECAAAMGIAGRQRVLERFTLDHARDQLRATMGLGPLMACKPEKATIV